MREISVESFQPVQRKVEIVERKGIGHPDTICDAIMDKISIALSEEYMNKIGHILHHNTDKALLVAGDTNIKFGGGEVIEPMKLIIGDRATFHAEGIDFAVNEIAVRTAKNWFRENLPHVDSDSVIYQSELKPGSPELVSIFKKRGILGANDTSAAVGYAPLSKIELLVLETEKKLNSREFKKEFPAIGEDIKIMGLRRGEDISLTIAAAFIDQYVESEEDYFRKKDELLSKVKELTGLEEIVINALDEKGKGLDGVYMTVTGTSAEEGDCGEVGRGNRVNGVIPLTRPSTLEAAAGKNPVSHVGKIYNVLCHKVAKEIYETTNVENIIWMVTKIGTPINEPMVAVQLFEEADHSQVQEIVNKELDNIQSFCMDLAKGKYTVC